jgi:hypothetical protein
MILRRRRRVTGQLVFCALATAAALFKTLHSFSFKLE